MVTGVGVSSSTVGLVSGNGVGIGNTQAPSAQQQQQPVESSHKRASDNRRSNKPIMEKRRRARINNCLNELKTLILDATKKDPARHSKLEKADILEKTVKHLQDLQRQQSVLSQASDPGVINKFKAGFTECANEVGRFGGIDPIVKRRLLQHLSNCLNGVRTDLSGSPQQQTASSQQIHILPSPPSSPEQSSSSVSESLHQVQQSLASHITLSSNGYFLMNGSGNVGVQLIPTKLTNGNIAFVVPHGVPQQATPLPMLIPIPNRNVANSSSSTNSNPPSQQSSAGSERGGGSETPVSSYGNASPPPLSRHSPVEVMDCEPSPLSSISPPTSPQQQVPQSVIVRTMRISPSFVESSCPSPSPVPLSLVVRKSYDTTTSPITPDCENKTESEEKPWRPW